MARILIIDDDTALCEVFSEFCNSLGHESACTFSLKEGFPLASAGNFDLVFLDVNLPDGNGMEAISRIKKASSSPEVVIITGEGSGTNCRQQ